MIESFLQFLNGNYNARQIKRLQRYIPDINLTEEHYQELTDEQLKDKFAEWKSELTQTPEITDRHIIEVFAGVKNAARRLCGQQFDIRGKDVEWNMVHFDVQLIGGLVLNEGNISEMKTGEGKTLVCTLPVILNALTGKGVHVITVNDYLAERDAEWMRPLYEFCGLSVGVITHGKSTEERRDAYNADITYGTNNEFGFDYLRDNMAQDPKAIVQRKLNYAIVDEVDSILIDEARTPLIISSPAEESTDKYTLYANIIPQLQENTDYTIDLKMKTATLTEGGVQKLEGLLGRSDLFSEAGLEEVHHIEQALKAHVIFEIDKDYVVRDDQVIIVDEFTGRLMPGRRFSDGLHQALEAKEKVIIQRESKTLATITFQNYFRLYDKLAGMTGTAETEAEEFAKIYKLDVIVIPTNKPLARQDRADKLFKTIKGKYTALAREVKTLHDKGQPVLIGTTSIEKSELIAHFLKQENIPHEILNAKHHEREAEIVSLAGQKGAVTIATNMAGRGTDIKLGDGVPELGGLAILGTERHESRRIDNQLRGRSGRQGDPGMSQFYISMEDDLLRRFGGERMQAAMNRLGIPDDEAIENKLFSRSVESAQKKIEGFHFDSRKHVLQYDDIMNVHREKIYAWRRTLLGSEVILEDIENLFTELIEKIVTTHAPTTEASKAWNTDEIFAVMQGIYIDEQNPITAEELAKFQHRDDLIESVNNYLLAAWDTKKQEYPEADVDRIAKYIVLRSIDELWLDHIDQMTQLRDRVALSGYAQRDPLMEYKREGFEMFRELMFQIRLTAVRNLFRVQFSVQMPLQTIDYSDAQTNADEIEESLTNTAEYGNKQEKKTEKFNSDTPGKSITSEKLGTKYQNVGRNDPCPCGSGKKFKKCHGQNL